MRVRPRVRGPPFSLPTIAVCFYEREPTLVVLPGRRPAAGQREAACARRACAARRPRRGRRDGSVDDGRVSRSGTDERRSREAHRLCPDPAQPHDRLTARRPLGRRRAVACRWSRVRAMRTGPGGPLPLPRLERMVRAGRGHQGQATQGQGAQGPAAGRAGVGAGRRGPRTLGRGMPVLRQARATQGHTIGSGPADAGPRRPDQGRRRAQRRPGLQGVQPAQGCTHPGAGRHGPARPSTPPSW